MHPSKLSVVCSGTVTRKCRNPIVNIFNTNGNFTVMLCLCDVIGGAGSSAQNDGNYELFVIVPKNVIAAVIRETRGSVQCIS